MITLNCAWGVFRTRLNPTYASLVFFTISNSALIYNWSMKYRRVYVPGATYFFTLVTYQRQSLFSQPMAVEALRQAFQYTMKRMPFTIVASVILPDHFHFIWTLPIDSADYSTRWRLIKSHFTRHWHSGGSVRESLSRQQKGERNIWQRRFWEHIIQDEHDLSNHIDYIHFNPVKHGLTDSPAKWKDSSYSKFVQDGYYPANWGKDKQVWPGEPQME